MSEVKISPRYAAVLFDLDGTLTDSAPGILNTIAVVLEQYGLHPSRESLRKYLGPPLRETFMDFLPDSQVEEAVRQYRTLYNEKGMYECTLYSGTEKMLRGLCEAGVQVCVATSKPQPLARKILEYFSLADAFTYIGGASVDTSRDTKAAVISHVLSQPCLQGKSAVMVGDRFHDMEGAKLCNLPAIGVLYGYGSRQELAAYHPSFLAQTADELCAHLLNTPTERIG